MCFGLNKPLSIQRTLMSMVPDCFQKWEELKYDRKSSNFVGKGLLITFWLIKKQAALKLCVFCEVLSAENASER
jgi:hypothetical protein